MYAALWRALPGGRLLKSLLAVALLLAAIAGLFFVVFPAVAPLMPWADVTVQPAAP
jgi:hypothetical protein